MRYRHRRIDDLSGACLPARLKVVHVQGVDRYTVTAPEAMKGVVFTLSQLEAFFQGDYDVITLRAPSAEALPCQA